MYNYALSKDKIPISSNKALQNSLEYSSNLRQKESRDKEARKNEKHEYNFASPQKQTSTNIDNINHREKNTTQYINPPYK